MKQDFVRKFAVILAAALPLSAASLAAYASCEGTENVAIPYTTPVSDFVIHNDGTVTHRVTGLTWMRCVYGQTWDGQTCTGDPEHRLWADALSIAEQFVFAGHDDWRVPNAKEMISIVEDRCADPPLNADVFPRNSWYVWTSTPDNNSTSDYSDNALVVIGGTMSSDIKFGPRPFRLVRGGIE